MEEPEHRCRSAKGTQTKKIPHSRSGKAKPGEPGGNRHIPAVNAPESLLVIER